MWRSGTNFNLIDYNNINAILKEVAKNKDHKIMIGSDSQLKGNYCLFVTAICIVNKYNKHHARYFYKKLLLNDPLYGHLSNRLLKETTESISLAEDIGSPEPFPGASPLAEPPLKPSGHSPG